MGQSRTHSGFWGFFWFFFSSLQALNPCRMQNSKTMRAVSAVQTPIFPSALELRSYMGSLGGCREQGHAPPATDIPQAGEDLPLTPKTGQQSQNAQSL